MNSPHGPSWATITAALETKVGYGKPAGAWVRYCCPSHEADGRGHRPSLGVKYDDHQQRTVVRCFAGCENEQVLDALGLEVRDMFDRRLERAAGRGRRAYRPRPQQRPASRSDKALAAAGLPPKQAAKPDLGRQISAWKQVAVYPYVGADGVVVGEVVRMHARFEGGRGKQFHQRRWNTEHGRMEKGGFEPIPYQLPQVLEQIADGGVVYIVEGEKDVAAAASAGLVATTNAGGAMSWSPEHAQWLRGATTVVIVADADTAGYRRADRVLSSLTGLVGRVRVVAAATGKDLTDHLQLGHEVSELVPVPYLDPYTPGPATTAGAAQALSTPAAETSTVSAAASTDPESLGGSVPEYLLAPSGEPVHTHADEVDSIGSHWSSFMRLFMTQLTEMARKAAEQRQHAARVAREKSEREAEEIAARHAAERKAVETRLAKLTAAGLGTASRTQLAEAITDAASWREESQIAAQMMAQLSGHVHHRYGVRIDPVTGEVSSDTTPDLAGALMSAEGDRAAAARLAVAQKRMVELVAGTEGLDEDRRAELYAAIEQWRAHPSARALRDLTQTMQDKGVPEKVRTHARFVAVYIGRPGDVVPMAELAETRAVQPTAELRRLPEALVDPGEEVKPRVDDLLRRYQDHVQIGQPTESIRARLTEAIAVMTPQDQAAARDRGRAIVANPGEEFPALWPDHVDRDELGTRIRMYATLAPQAELAAGKASDIDDATAAGLARQAAKHRAAIIKAVKSGKGLHDLERDQIGAVLRDIEAGKTHTPDLLWADDRSAAAVDADRATRIGRDTSHAHKRQLEQILGSNHAPQGTVRRVRADVGRVMDAQTHLGTGGMTLPDYERLGLDRQLGAKLSAVGVPEPLRNKVQHHLDYAAGESATVGKQAQRIADRWADRRDAVVTARSVAGAVEGAPDYDSPARRAELERAVRASGVSEDSVEQRMAADAGRARPPSAAVRTARGGTRRTSPGAGVSRTQHRGRRGKGPEKGLGR